MTERFFSRINTIDRPLADFYRHIFPQITKFFGFFRSPSSQNDLVEKLFAIINADAALKGEFRKFLGEKEIFKFLKDICEDSQNILLIIDGEKEELPEIINTYTDTRGKLVKILKIKKFTNETESLVSVEPDFVGIQYAPIVEVDDEDSRAAHDDGFWRLSPAERAADFRRWAASHESGPGLPDSAVGRDAIYD